MTRRCGLAVAVLVLALLAALTPAMAQERIDLIILLDSSRSMFRYYNQVIDFVVSDTIREYLRFGDGFHLMNFADTTQLEVAQVLRTEEDVRTVLSRLYLMYPLGRNTDLIAALKGVSQYAAGLGSASSKFIILITDGMHSPAQDSIYASYSADDVRAEMERSATRIRERGWKMRIVQVPFNGTGRTNFDTMEATTATGDQQKDDKTISTTQPRLETQPVAPTQPSAQPSGATIGTSLPFAGSEEGEVLSEAPGTGDYLNEIAEALGTGISAFDPDNTQSTVAGMVDILHVSYPKKIKTRSRSFKIRLDIENPSARRIPMEFEGLVLPDGFNILSSRTLAVLEPGQSVHLECIVKLPDSIPEGISNLTVEPRLANDVRVSPAKGIISVDLKISIVTDLFKNSASLFMFLLILFATLAVLILVIHYIRMVHRRAEEPVLQAFMGLSETRDEPEPVAERNRRPAKTVSISQDPGPNLDMTDSRTLERSQTLGKSLSLAQDHEVRKLALMDAAKSGQSSVHPDKRNQAILDTAANTRSGEDRSKLLEQWSSGDRTRYILPLRSAAAKKSTLATGAVTAYAYQPKVSKHGTLRVELKVRNQNPLIGSRNIKTLHAGRSMTIGGKSSDFLVFLLPVPKRIADVHFDGQAMTIVPVRPAYFPDYSGPIEIKPGDEIRIVNSRGKALFMRFERYTPPLEKLNRLMHCIEVAGIASDTEVIPQS